MIERLRPDRLPNREPAWYAVDALLVVALGFFTVDSVRSPIYVDEYGAVEGALGWALVLGPTLLLLVRRTAPATVLAASSLLYVLAGIDHGDGNAIMYVPFATYMVAYSRPPKVSAWMVGLAAVPVSLTAVYGPGDVLPIAVPVVVGLHYIGWAVGARVRRNQLRAHELAVEAVAARKEAAQVAEQAVADERARIARELHDAVGHAVNVMVMQAGAARLGATDERTAAVLRDIERVGRSALTDLDRMLGLLRGDAEHAPLEPAHGLADVATLVDGVRSAGADVTFVDECSAVVDSAVERPIGAAAYRIVQEALTNAVKHAGPAHIEVRLTCTSDELTVSVSDDGRGAAAPRPRHGGRGLAGMGERVSVLGGTLRAGPRPGGGFVVEARLPRKQGLR